MIELSESITQKLLKNRHIINQIADNYGFENIRIFKPVSEEDEDKINLLVDIKHNYIDKISLYEKARLRKSIEEVLSYPVIVLISSMIDHNYLSFIEKNSSTLAENNEYISNFLGYNKPVNNNNEQLLQQMDTAIQKMSIEDNGGEIAITITVRKNSTQDSYTQSVISYLQKNSIESHIESNPTRSQLA